MGKLTKVFKYVLFLILIICLYGCSSQKNIEESSVKYSQKETTLSIITTNDFVKNTVGNIVGDKHIVESIFNNNGYIEKYSFTEDAYKNISKQDIFFYLGGEYEPYVEELTSKIPMKNVSLANVSRGASLIENEKKEINPYYFYSINNYKSILLNIKNSVEERDPKNRDFYEKNFQECVKKIDEVNQEIREIEQNAKDTTLITSEDKFDYLLKELNMTRVLLPENFNANDAESVNNISQLLGNTIKDKKYVVYLYDDDNQLKNYQSLLSEKDIKSLKFNTVFGNYIGGMKSNLIKLKELTK